VELKFTLFLSVFIVLLVKQKNLVFPSQLRHIETVAVILEVLMLVFDVV